MYFHLAYLGNRYLIFTFSVNDPLPDLPKFLRNGFRTKNTLRRWEKDYKEAKNVYFHLAYLGNIY